MSNAKDSVASDFSAAVSGQPFPPELVERSGCPFDPPAGRTRLHEQAPMSKITLLNGAQAWLVTGYDEALAILADTRFSSDNFRYTSALQLTPEQVEETKDNGFAPNQLEREDGMFLLMDPPEHTRLRRVLAGQFTTRRMQALENRVREISVQLIDDMRAQGTEADLVQSFALPLPSMVICELLGVPYEDRDGFQARSATTLDTSKPLEERRQAGFEQYEFMRNLVATKRQRPGDDDILSGMIHGDLIADPPVTDSELVDIGTLLLDAGHETTANQLALSTFALLQNPDQLAALRADPSLIDSGVEELLRYLSIVHMAPFRVATEDLNIGGFTIAEGDTVVVSTPNVNRHPGLWHDPDKLDLSRPRSRHLAFGHGVHQCIGQQLARVELRIGLTELLTRLPDLHLTVPAEEIQMRTQMIVFGVHTLPVGWR
jgi:cytochrome P450